MICILILVDSHHGYITNTFNYSYFYLYDPYTSFIYTLSLHDALPICLCRRPSAFFKRSSTDWLCFGLPVDRPKHNRSEEHTSELQSRLHLVCRLLLEKKKKKKI